MTGWSRKAALLLAAAVVMAGPAGAEVPANGGPYNAEFLPGGIGIERAIGGDERVAAAGAPYSFSVWIKADARQAGDVPLIALGEARALTLKDGRLTWRDGAATIAGPVLTPGRWTQVTASSDGTRGTLYVDGGRVAQTALASTRTMATLHVARALPGAVHFGGTLVGATLHDDALTAQQVTASVRARPD
ncbi:MAG: LamG domain-containing protein, partial [Pseudomonadota bacterium]|nr:LamG domain-containing protein [Pseudomonadota bacterium]